MNPAPLTISAQADFTGKGLTARRKLLLASVTLCCGLVLLSGCAAALLTGGAAAGAGAVAYVRGELKSTEAAALEKVWTATLAAMSDLEFSVTKKEKDALSARAVARGANDKKIQVDLKRLSDRDTEVRIRVGILGDESISRQVLDKIKKRL
ncbi:MAG: DUF3568 family protein [Verrucomicrobia bacterium]|nr:DUF3568 family protein [Verrucomicrobiota bacterium]